MDNLDLFTAKHYTRFNTGTSLNTTIDLIYSNASLDVGSIAITRRLNELD